MLACCNKNPLVNDQWANGHKQLFQINQSLESINHAIKGSTSGFSTWPLLPTNMNLFITKILSS